MTLASMFFNFIFYSNTSSLVFQLRRDDCITFCSSFVISALPGVEDAELIKQSRVALLLVNDTTIIKPIEFHTSISFDFNRQKWIHNDFYDLKSVSQDHWIIDEEYNLKYPILQDS